MGLFSKKLKKAPDMKQAKTVSEQLSAMGIPFKELPPLKSAKTPPAIAELEQKLQTGMEVIKANPESDEINATEMRFLAYGLDFIDFAKNNFNIALTLAEKDIEVVEEIALQAHNGYQSGHLPKDNLMPFATMFAGYVGLIITIHKGGEWISEHPSLKEAGPGISINGEVVFVLSKAYRRIQNGSEDNLVNFYRTIEYAAM